MFNYTHSDFMHFRLFWVIKKLLLAIFCQYLQYYFSVIMLCFKILFKCPNPHLQWFPPLPKWVNVHVPRRKSSWFELVGLDYESIKMKSHSMECPIGTAHTALWWSMQIIFDEYLLLRRNIAHSYEKFGQTEKKFKSDME